MKMHYNLELKHPRYHINDPVTSPQKEPVLHVAVKNRIYHDTMDDSVQLILTQDGVDVNARDYMGSTALMKAAAAGRVAAMKMILERY